MAIYNINGSSVSANREMIPYFIPPTSTNEYEGNTLNSAQFYALYDEMLGTHSNGLTVTKTLVGKDQSNTYDVYKYVFEPKNYDRTIIISSGMHGWEITPMFALLTMMQQVVGNNKWIDLFRYLREKVKIVVVPLQNPWGFNQSPRKYPNSRMVNENRNFGIKGEWEAFDVPTYGDASDQAKGKGTAPFSEAETVNMRSVVYEYMHDADFWFDLHSSRGWNYDYYVQCNASDKYMHDAISDALDNSIKPYLTDVLGITTPTGLFNDPDTALKLHYTYKVLNLSCCTVEMTPERFGGSECGSVDLKVYQLMFGNYLVAALNSFTPRNRANHNHKDAQNNVLQAPNGAWYKISVSNTGELVTEEM